MSTVFQLSTVLNGMAIVVVIAIFYFLIWRSIPRAQPLNQNDAVEQNTHLRRVNRVTYSGRKNMRQDSNQFSDMSSESLASGHQSANENFLKQLKRFAEKEDKGLPILQKKSPPVRYLEADWPEHLSSDHRLPSDIFYLLQSMRVFGHLEKSFFIELCKFMELITVNAGEYLFTINDTDNCLYIVQYGLVEVFITEQDGSNHLVKVVKTGDSIHSLLSILDVLTGHTTMYKTVSAKAVVSSTIVKLPILAFNTLFENFSESVVRLVQIIMVRLQRVTFVALNNYLGLSNELINDKFKPNIQSLHIHSLKGLNLLPVAKRQVTFKGPELTLAHDDVDADFATKLQIAQAENEKLKNMSDFSNALMRARVLESDVDVKPFLLPPESTSSSSLVVSTKLIHQSVIADEPPGPSVSEEIVLDLVQKDLISLLQIKNPDLLNGKLSLRSLQAEFVLCKQGDQNSNLVFVVQGSLNVFQHSGGESNNEVKLYTASPGEFLGMLAVLTGEPSLFTIRCKTKVMLAVIMKADFYRILQEEPFIVLHVSRLSVQRMSDFVRQIDLAIDWQVTEAGQALFRQGDSSDSVYIILTGRLRSVITLHNGKKEIISEFGKGELVGIVEVLTHTKRATTVMAIRDTEVAKVPEELLTLIKMKYPKVVTELFRLLGQRILGTLENQSKTRLTQSTDTEGGYLTVDNTSMTTNLATVAILPVSENVPIENFTLELQHALGAIGPTVWLTSEKIKSHLGSAALDSVNEYRLSSWLNQQEDIHRMVLYQCDTTASKWTKHCIRQADAILIVAVADLGPMLGELEKEVEHIASRAHKELILLHKEDADTPSGTAEWLNAREWCSSHHHIRCNNRVFNNKMRKVYDLLLESEPNRMSDFSRLARFLTGTSIGLVLGGGGARGFAHVGLIKALQEVNIPIDMLGGTSIGAFICALWGEDCSSVRMHNRAQEWSVKADSAWNLLDLTYPYTAMFTGDYLNKSLEATFHNRQIEDLWLPYFCVTTDITNSSMRIHTSGSLWRYVRASMTISGWLPPLCDPVDGHLLVDGSYVNNLPADILHMMGAQTVFAIDVASQNATPITNYGDQLSGWWLLWNRWNPWSHSVRVPDMTEIQSRLAYVSCTRQLELVKNSDYCEYIRPPIDKYSAMYFGACDEIAEVGYYHGKSLFAVWTKGGLISKLFKEKRERAMRRKTSQTYMPGMDYFSDLAEIVSRIKKPHLSFDDKDEECSSPPGNTQISQDDVNIVTAECHSPEIRPVSPSLTTESSGKPSTSKDNKSEKSEDLTGSTSLQ